MPSRWVTRERPKIDRIACPWLIRRFIDPEPSSSTCPPTEVFARRRREPAPRPTTSRASSFLARRRAVQLRCVPPPLRLDDRRSSARDDRARRRHGALDLAPQAAGTARASRSACPTCSPTTTRCSSTASSSTMRCTLGAAGPARPDRRRRMAGSRGNAREGKRVTAMVPTLVSAAAADPAGARRHACARRSGSG